MERLAFGYGTARHTGEPPERSASPGVTCDAVAAPAVIESGASRSTERRDWAFVGLMVFTGLLFFRFWHPPVVRHLQNDVLRSA